MIRMFSQYNTKGWFLFSHQSLPPLQKDQKEQKVGDDRYNSANLNPTNFALKLQTQKLVINGICLS